MSYFDDLLNRPLPSASTDSYFEDGDDFEKDMDNLANEFDADESGVDCECSDPDFSSHDEDGDDGVDGIIGDIMNAGEDDDDDDQDDDDEDDDEDDDDGDESDSDIDSDLADLEREVGVNGSLPDDDDDNYVPQSVDDPTPAKPVTGQDDEDADRMLAICATPTILDNSLTVEEAVEFIESGESDIAINEGLMLESDLSTMLADLSDDNGEFTEAVKFAQPGRKYMMTKKARLKQLFELSLQIEARAHHDPYYKKIQKAYKIERTIKEGWRKRYGNLAMKRAKRYLKALMTSKSPTLKKAAKRMGGGK